MFKNKRGEVFTFVAAAVAGCVLFGFVQTANNGVLKKNGQRIWCKMQGKDAAACDSQYK